eukprot:6727796-Prymnesium_polylepis.1
MRARTLALGGYGWCGGSSGGVAPCRRSPTRRPPAATARSDARDDSGRASRSGARTSMLCDDRKYAIPI